MATVATTPRFLKARPRVLANLPLVEVEEGIGEWLLGVEFVECLSRKDQCQNCSALGHQ
jgi:hypothetical protein